MIEALDIRVRGIVQGVGFRPFVYRLARRHIITGWVLNDLDGVFIHAEGESQLLDEFVTELHMNPPSAAVVREVELKEVPLQDCTTFEIRESQVEDADEVTLVSADLGMCDDCRRELFDPTDRRFRYPFINCTNCGPRFTIIDSLPYDRPATSMRSFDMCDDCAREYADPGDRRFHAQPDACFSCGPCVSWIPLSAAPRSEEPCATPRLSAAPCSEGPCEMPQLSAAPESGGGFETPRSATSPDDGFIATGDSFGRAQALRSSSKNKKISVQRVSTPPPDSGAADSWGISQGPSEHGAATSLELREWSDSAFAAAVELLACGGIVAVKGLGGFHLVCDASNAWAISELRRRKRRDGKALAVMVADVAAAVKICKVSPEEAALLESAARPIVLLRKRPDASITPGLADGLPELGVMLPATPVQALLIHDFCEATGGNMLVMTSGNVHDEPIVVDDAEACVKLAGIADAVLGNNRPILSRYDDSVVRAVNLGGVNEHGEPNVAVQFIRRARGYAPVPMSISEGVSTVFAAGSEQKNTFAYARDGQAFVSQHIGDMEDADVYDAWLESKARFEKLFDLSPQLLACDMHPEYLASKWAHEEAGRIGAPLVEVQHHHAHIASVLGEHGLAGPAIGFAFDGTGYGADGAIWGGEVLLANQADYERFANFTYLPMPGGAAAVKHPLRMAYGMLWAFDLLEHPGVRDMLGALGNQAEVFEQMIESGLNTPHTSSVGRLFDAVSALLGVCTEPMYEGEPAILLDAVRSDAQDPDPDGYSISITKNSATESSTAHDTSVVLLDAEAAVRAILDDMVAGVPVGVISHRFHNAIVDAIVQVAELVRVMYGINLVALSGGCFMNRYLVEQAASRLGEAGFTVALNASLPPNDGCVSYGQAVVACASR